MQVLLCEFVVDMGDETVYGSACFAEPTNTEEWRLLPLDIHAGILAVLTPRFRPGITLRGFEVNCEPFLVRDGNIPKAIEAMSSPANSANRWSVEVSSLGLFRAGLRRRDRWGVQ